MRLGVAAAAAAVVVNEIFSYIQSIRLVCSNLRVGKQTTECNRESKNWTQQKHKQIKTRTETSSCFFFLWRHAVACNVDGIILNIIECNDRYAYVYIGCVLPLIARTQPNSAKQSIFICNYTVQRITLHLQCVCTSRKAFARNFIVDYIHKYSRLKTNMQMISRS